MERMNTPNLISIALVDDEPHIRTRFAELLGAHDDLRLEAAFAGASDAIEWLEGHEPDVLLCDLGLPDGSGLEVIRSCAGLHPTCNIMVITVFGDEQNVLSAIQAGAKGYLLKDDIGDSLAGAVRTLLDGGSPMSPIIARQILQRLMGGPDGMRRPDSRPGRAQDKLSVREAEVLELISRGYTYAESGRQLQVTLHTVQGHIKSIYSKLAVHSRTDAISEAQRLGLLETPPR